MLMTARIIDINDAEATVAITNKDGQERTFTLPIPDSIRVKVVWNYDENGEPINVRLVDAGAPV